MSRVSLAICFCLSSGRNLRVLRLWVRSASLMKITRRSLIMVRMILRIVSAWRTSGEDSWTRLILVTPSTKSATSWPKFSWRSAAVMSVSSRPSWRRPARGGGLASRRDIGRLEPLLPHFRQRIAAGASQDEHRDSPDVHSENDVIGLVADHIRAAEVDPEVCCRSQGAAGIRLPAVAFLAVPGIIG